MTTAVYAIIQFFIGISLGFFLDEWNEEKSITVDFNEIAISTFAFMIINIFALWFNDDYNIYSFIILTLGWFSIMLGIIVGNLGRSSVVDKILNVIRKKDIQLTLKDMIQISYKYVHRADENTKEKLEKLEQEIICALEQIIASMVKINNTKMKERFEKLKLLCKEYIELTEIIAEEKDKELKDQLIDEWIEIGEYLSKISWDTLNHAQEEIMQRFKKIWARKESRG